MNHEGSNFITPTVNYEAPLKDMAFQLKTFGYEDVANLEDFEDFDLETAIGVLNDTADFLTEQWLPTNAIGDRMGVKYNPVDKSVTTPDGFKEAYEKYVETGYLAIGYPTEYDGEGAPHMLSLMIGEIQIATNKSLSMCPGLSHGLISSLKEYGTQEQKDTWIPKLVSGEWGGTMCLTEPQAGTDLGLVYTTAVPKDDGSYNLNGQKIWITFGEHDLTENIIHLVLARLPGAPEGIKGISTFIVPKFKLDGTRNGIYCTGVDHKMGINGSPTCVMSMEDAEGYLIGTPHKGMRCMFVMMNEARLSVGLEGLSLSEASYQSALDFSKERLQGRSLNKARNETDKEADTILSHPDVRRQLLRIRSTTEAMRGLACYVAKHIDFSHHHPDEKTRKTSDDIVALLTPIIKSFFTDRGFLNTSDAMQICGGIGYTQEWPIEQYMRDVRIAMIYEGTNHVQGLDLVGRKLLIGGGRLIRTFGAEMMGLLGSVKGDERFDEFAKPTKHAFDTLTKLTMHLAMNGPKDPEMIAAVASEYLNVFGYATFAFSWLHQVKAAFALDNDYGATKIKLARFYFRHVFPEIDAHAAMVMNGKDAMMDFDADEF
jgi:alkylation response protein AidB-like acyl-CoA dehydrogenase